jgi:hypothetical protein
MRDGCANVTVGGAGTGKNYARDFIAPHGFEDVVGDDGFLFEIEPGVVNAPARVGICSEVKHLIYAVEVRQDFLQIEQFDRNDLEPGIAFVVREMFASARRKIIQDSDFLGGSICQQCVNQVRANEASAASNEID